MTFVCKVFHVGDNALPREQTAKRGLGSGSRLVVRLHTEAVIEGQEPTGFAGASPVRWSVRPLRGPGDVRSVGGQAFARPFGCLEAAVATSKLRGAT